MADYAPIYGRPHAMTYTAGATIVGGQLVAVSAADTVIPSVVNGAPVGVAAHDAASGGQVTVLMGSGVVHETTASVAVPAAGVLLYAGPTGGVSPTAGTGPPVGVSVRTALITALCRWKSVM